MFIKNRLVFQIHVLPHYMEAILFICLPEITNKKSKKTLKQEHAELLKEL
jgi:hypothetical protein